MTEEEVEFPCPTCGAVNRIAEDLVPPNGEIRCGHCGETVSLTRNPGIPESVGVASSLPPSPLDDEPTDTLVRIDDPDPAPPAQEVCCPNCGHHFDPDLAAVGRKTVLIVEDTDFFLQLATDVLGQEFQTIGARTVAEARKVLATTPVQLLVLDLTLPDAEGTEVLRALPRSDIPVLIYTSRDETSLIGPEWQVLASLGANDVIHKGINMEDALLQKAQELAGERPVAAG